MISIDLVIQQELDTDPKVRQQISFTGNLHQAGNITMFFILEEAKETIIHLSFLDFTRNCKAIVILFLLNIMHLLKKAQDKSLDVELSNSQLHKLKLSIKN